MAQRLFFKAGNLIDLRTFLKLDEQQRSASPQQEFFYELCPKHSNSQAWDGTTSSFSDPVFYAVQRNAYPELELAVGSFPYSSLATPTTDERAAVTDSISIAYRQNQP